MKRLFSIYKKETRYIIGLMSGTSIDGIDAALVKIKGNGLQTKVELIAFNNYKYSTEMKQKIYKLLNPKTSTVEYICHMNFLLGELFSKAAQDISNEANFPIEKVDIIASHGQTIYHIPEIKKDSGYLIRSTFQIGEPAVIAERTGVITVSNFRTRDVAAGGQGAPLVPYTDYLLYRSYKQNIALQNIGGISNITVLPKNCSLDEIIAFDNGPGNMVIDSVVQKLTNGKYSYDKDGLLAKSGQVNNIIVNKLMNNKYFKIEPPKTTGRELFNNEYVEEFIDICKKDNLSIEDTIATATAFTAEAISDSYEKFIKDKCNLDVLILSGGGSYNQILVKMIRDKLSKYSVKVITQEGLGNNSDAKEAIAFAILGNETITGNFNNVPIATGAKKNVILGNITI